MSDISDDLLGDEELDELGAPSERAHSTTGETCGCEQRGARFFWCPYHEGFEDGRDEATERAARLCDEVAKRHFDMAVDDKTLAQADAGELIRRAIEVHGLSAAIRAGSES